LNGVQLDCTAVLVWENVTRETRVFEAGQVVGTLWRPPGVFQIIVAPMDDVWYIGSVRYSTQQAQLLCIFHNP
jgi:hypothetical protein